MQRSTALFFILAIFVGCILFKVKYEVVEVEQKLAQTVQQISQENENIHILKAEWSHLNEPQRLQKLAQKFLDISPIKTEKITAVAGDFEKDGNFKALLPHSHLASLEDPE